MLDVSTRRWTTTAFCILIAGSGCNNDHRKTATGDAGPAPDVGARDENVLTPDGRAPDSSAELRADNVRSQDADAGVNADTKPDFTVDVQPVDLRLQDDPSPDASARDAFGEIRSQDTPRADALLFDTSGLDSPEASSSAGSPTAQDLQGAWHSPWTSADSKAVAHRRFRFLGNSYAFVYDTQTSYCAETGSFTLTAGQVQFHPSNTIGIGNCAGGRDRVASIAWDGSGVVLSDDTGPIPYLPTRAVPKVFATVEKHDGNLAGDSTLPGNNAMAKADALCNASIAKPDEGPYRALLIDGSSRTALPAHDWVLKPNTTYFQPDGVLNVFTTNASAVASQDANHPVVGSYGGDYVWSNLGCDFSGNLSCQGWTSNQAESTPGYGPVAGVVAPASSDIFACNQAVTCAYPCGLLCASVIPDSTGTNPDGGTGIDGPPVNLQGAWVGKPSVAGIREARRLLFENIRYTIVRELGDGFSQPGSYCIEVGTFDATTAEVRFRPERMVGHGSCAIGDDRVESLSLSVNGISLSDQGTLRAYARAPDVAKLFVTVEGHNGNFAGDQTLPGGSVIDKADAFCQQSAARPDGQKYKAVLVDGILRSLSPTVDSPFKPNTTYYDASGASQAIATDAAGALSKRFDAALVSYPLYTWTGFNSDLQTSDTCKAWTSASMQDRGRMGMPSGPPPLSSSIGGECGVWDYSLVCASQ